MIEWQTPDMIVWPTPDTFDHTPRAIYVLTDVNAPGRGIRVRRERLRLR